MDDKIKIDLSVTDDTNENKKNSQARDWCFTINNPVQSEQEFLEYLNTVTDLRYAVFQRERAPETGTEHYQGYFEFTQPKWFTTIKKCLSKENIGVDAHIEQRKGKRSQAREYCMDEETRISPQYYECCEPIPGDRVVGYRDPHSGRIIVHKSTCDKLIKLAAQFGNNIIKEDDIKWSQQKAVSYLASVELYGIDRAGIILDLTRLITSDFSINMRAISVQSHDGIFEGTISIYVQDIDSLNALLDNIRKIKGIESVKRLLNT